MSRLVVWLQESIQLLERVEANQKGLVVYQEKDVVELVDSLDFSSLTDIYGGGVHSSGHISGLGLCKHSSTFRVQQTLYSGVSVC